MRAIVATLAAALLAGSASAQNVAGGDSGLKGSVVSRTVAAAMGTTVPIYVTPTKGHFVLTQFCWGEAAAGGALLSGSTLGQVATHRQNCRGYDPGLAFGAGETLSCVNTGTGVDLVCTITGVQTAR
jgi:hypothetical protein